MTKATKSKKYNKRIFIVLLLVLSIAAVGSLVYIQLYGGLVLLSPTAQDKKLSKNPNCSSTISIVDELFEKENFQEATKFLDKNNDYCKDEKNNGLRLQYFAKLAVANYKIDEKDKSKKYADTALDIRFKLRVREVQSVPGIDAITISMRAIKQGTYNGVGIF